MANGKNGTWKIMAGVAFSAIVLFGTGLIAWGQITQKVDSMQVQVDKNSDARDTTLQLEPRVQNIEEDVKEIKENMREGFRAILKKLDEQ